MYTELFQDLGLAQNEARIYETLLREGESPVGRIATESKVHRRNVYDSLNRLIEKGLVFEIIQHRENHYKAVDPNKLSDVLQEKQQQLNKVLPSLVTLYESKPHNEDVYIYRGTEGWKNYMQDILRIGKDRYCFGAKAAINHDRLHGYFDHFLDEIQKRPFKFYNLYDHTIKGTKYEGHISSDYRFLPKKYNTTCTVTILEDRVFFFSGVGFGEVNEDFAITVIVNPEIAHAYKIWFQFMWDSCPPVKNPKSPASFE